MKRTPRNADYTKNYNRNLVLRLLRHRQMSRADLAAASGLTRASVSLIVEELQRQGVVEELEPTATKRGRTPLPLAIRGGVYCAVGVYLNRSGCQMGVVDLNGTLLEKRSLSPGACSDTAALVSAAAELLVQAQPDGSKMLGIGVSAPGPLDSGGGRILNPPGFERWHGAPVRQMLTEKTGQPVWLENNACTLAQYYCEAKGLRDALLLLVDSGVGSGVISGGRLLQSGGGFTSELGHTTIDFNGRLCSCGGRGCLEAYAAVPNLLRGTAYTSWRQLVENAAQGVPDAAELLEQEAAYLSAGITNLVNLVDVDTVILAGDISWGFETFRPLLEKRLQGRLIGRTDRAVALETMSAETDTQICAAAAAVFRNFLTEPV